MAPHVTIRLVAPIRAASVAGPGAPASPAGPHARGPVTLGEDPRARLEAERNGLVQARRALEEAARDFLALKEQFVREAEPAVVDLAFQIARRVLSQEIDAGRYCIEPIVHEILHRVPARHNVSLHLNPEDAAQWQASVRAEAGAADVLAGARIVPDGHVGRGECLVDTSEGGVRSTMEERLALLAEALQSQGAPCPS